MALKKLLLVILSSGVNPLRIIRSAAGVLFYLRDLLRFLRLSRRVRAGQWRLSILPIFGDRFESSGVAKGHYFHQDLLIARKIFARRPNNHLDVGSRVDGFISHLLVFMDVTVVDIRPLNSEVRGLTYRCGDITARRFAGAHTYDSVSSLHAVEHFGLGRYGDPVDPLAWISGVRNLASLVSPGGFLYLSVPVGKQRVEFNAHRVFNCEEFVGHVSRLGFELVSFGYVDDAGALVEDGALADANRCNYGCGIFEFKQSG